MIVACALLPRFELLAALGGRERLGDPIALAPTPGAPQLIGEVSAAAEAYGVRPGIGLSEALARCPSLELVTPDPDRAEERWEVAVRRLEEIGAEVEAERPGEAFFSVGALVGLYGGPAPALARAGRALGTAARLGAGPTRLCAQAAARRARARRAAPIVAGRDAERFVAELPITALRDRLPDRWQAASLPETLERLGIGSIGEFAALPAAAIADRFGEPGLRALRIARGEEPPLRPRRGREEIVASLELGDALAGPGLERAIALLVDRLLADPARGGRSLRRLRIEVRLAGAGGWRSEIAMRSASADPERLRSAAVAKLAALPGPAERIALRALELGEPPSDQASLGAADAAQRRRGLLGEAVRQVRAAAGRDSVLQILDVDPDSRIPERRAVLTPFPERSELDGDG
ncbi:hypothetical protein HJD18_07475 [Thermoleophilia bacterium SCSIO 60948]|nr:hypothetical protein HJD18_07475 [Thermoleophilia bacterium SCSIO 60948]